VALTINQFPVERAASFNFFRAEDGLDLTFVDVNCHSFDNYIEGVWDINVPYAATISGDHMADTADEALTA
jgi:hypothetical protein